MAHSSEWLPCKNGLETSEVSMGFFIGEVARDLPLKPGALHHGTGVSEDLIVELSGSTIALLRGEVAERQHAADHLQQLVLAATPAGWGSAATPTGQGFPADTHGVDGEDVVSSVEKGGFGVDAHALRAAIVRAERFGADAGVVQTGRAALQAIEVREELEAALRRAATAGAAAAAAPADHLDLLVMMDTLSRCIEEGKRAAVTQSAIEEGHVVAASLTQSSQARREAAAALGEAAAACEEEGTPERLAEVSRRLQEARSVGVSPGSVATVEGAMHEQSQALEALQDAIRRAVHMDARAADLALLLASIATAQVARIDLLLLQRAYSVRSALEERIAAQSDLRATVSAWARAVGDADGTATLRCVPRIRAAIARADEAGVGVAEIEEASDALPALLKLHKAVLAADGALLVAGALEEEDVFVEEIEVAMVLAEQVGVPSTAADRGRAALWRMQRGAMARREAAAALAEAVVACEEEATPERLAEVSRRLQEARSVGVSPGSVAAAEGAMLEERTRLDAHEAHARAAEDMILAERRRAIEDRICREEIAEVRFP